MPKDNEVELPYTRTYVVSLRDAYRAPRKKRAKVAVRILRDFILRHTKADYVKLSNEVNEYIWSRSIEKPPRKVPVCVRVYRDENDMVAAEVKLLGTEEKEGEEEGKELETE